MAYAQRSNMGGHPDHGMGGTASQGSAGSGMESAYGGQAIGVYGGKAAGQNEMGSFLDAMQERYGLESVTNFIDNYLNKYMDEVAFPNPPAGFRDFNYDSQTTPLDRQAPVMGMENFEGQTSTLDYGVPAGAMSNMPGVNPNLEMSGRMTPAQLAALDSAQGNTQNFTEFDQGFIDQMMQDLGLNTSNTGPQGGGGGDYRPPIYTPNK